MFHAGVVRALQHAGLASTGPIIGTSAGSSIAAGLAFGGTVDDIVGHLDRPPSDEDIAEFRAIMEDRTRTWLPLAPRLLAEVRPGGRGAGIAISGILPPGRFPTWRLGSIVEHITGTPDAAWPDDLWIPATRLTDRATVVFGRDDRSTTVGEAIEASSALPGVMEPKILGSTHFIDGGAISPTHADLAVAAPSELVIIASPMSRPGPRPLGVLARRRLAAELDTLHDAGRRTIVVEPPAGSDQLFRNYPRRDRNAGAELMRIGTRSAAAALAAAGL